MTRLLALEWNEDEARVVVASSHRGTVVFEQAFSVPLVETGQQPAPTGTPEDEPMGKGPSADSGPPSRDTSVESSASTGRSFGIEGQTIGQKIAQAVAARRLGRLDVLVALGRSNIELRQLTLPPAPEEELPALVRFQAIREFNELDEDWLLDFVPIDEAPDQPRTVLAAAIGPELVAQVQEVCAAAGWTPRRLVLRPCAAASLVGRLRPGSAFQSRLLIDLLGDEADLTVMVDRKVIFLRTARLPGDPLSHPDAASALLAQIRRTMAAVQNQLEGRQVASILLCGDGADHEALARQIDRQLATPTELFNPFEGLERAEELATRLPEHPGRYAPLLGMLWDEFEEVPPAIDFFHPRQPTAPPSPRRKLVVAGVIAWALLLGFFGYSAYTKYHLSSEVQRLQQATKELDRLLKEAEEAEKAYTKIAQWGETNIHWLEEFRRLSEKFPPAKEAMVSEMRFESAARGGGIYFEGYAADLDKLDRLESNLRDSTHQVVRGKRAEDTSLEPYSWKYGINVYVLPQEEF